MTSHTVKHIKNGDFELIAKAEDGRCDADMAYWFIRIDGGLHSDGYEATLGDAIKKCQQAVAEWEYAQLY